MRRLVFVPIMLMGFAAAFAIGGSAARTARTLKEASGIGTIKALGNGAITVHSVFDLTCKLTSRSPATTSFSTGSRVKIVCIDGVLVRIRPAAGHSSASGDTSLSDQGGVTTASGVGVITSLTTVSVTVTGDRSLTCTVGNGSPGLGDYHLGDRVRIGCVDGVLYVIARIADTPSTTSTTSTTTSTTTAPATTTSNAYGAGSITTLTSSVVTVTGDSMLTCSLGPSSPPLGDFKLGERVKIGCRNGILVAIVAADAQAAQTTTTTTTPSSTTTTGTTTSAYGVGTITALGGSGITVTGDNTLNCAISGDSPSLGDYHVGDAVKIGCRNGVLYGIVRNTATGPTPTTSSTTTTTTSTAATYASGTITALSATSVTVSGTSGTLTCEVAANGPSPTAYGFKEGDHLTIACQNGVLTHVSTV